MLGKIARMDSLNDVLIMLHILPVLYLSHQLSPELLHCKFIAKILTQTLFCLNLCIPFLDHLINGIDTRVDKYGKIVLTIMGLVPFLIATQNDIPINEAIQLYSEDLPNVDSAEEEFLRWKRRWAVTPERERPQTVASALKKCDASMYPNLFVLLQIAATIPVTPCECERSGSVLRRLNRYLRSSMGQPRLSGLALMHILREKNINVERVIDIFASKPRALELLDICS